jgi:hypothetical protein
VIGGVSGTKNFVENQASPVELAPAATLQFGSSISHVLVTMSDAMPNDEIIGVVGSFLRVARDDCGGSGCTGLGGQRGIKLTGGSSTTVSEFQTALRGIKFSNTGEMMEQTAARNVQVFFAAYHNENVVSATREVTVAVQPVNDRPVVAGTTVSATFTQNGAPVAIASGVVFTDKDSKILQSITVTITNSHTGDMLSTNLTTTSSIQTTFFELSGALLLSGPATIAEFEAAARTITFYSVARLPHTEARSVSITASDGTAASSSVPLVSITVCAAKGFYANSMLERVQACTQGSYQTQTCSSSCTGCAVGMFGKALAHALAPATSNAAHCIPCARGTYQSLTGQTECVACAAGRYGSSLHSRTAASHCQLCSVGFAQNSTGTTSCTGCAAGTYAHTEGLATCIAFSCCGAGSYKSGNSAGSDGICAFCAQGHFKGTSGGCLATCSPCGTGKYGAAAIPGSSSRHCVDCPTGQFQDKVGQTDGANGQSEGCTECFKGRYQSSTGHAGCTICATGTYQDTVGQNRCKKCARGKYGDTSVGGQSSSSYCVACVSGKFNELDGLHGENSCAPCDAGKHADPSFATSDARHCTACEVGRFSNTVALAAQCKECATGQFQTSAGKTECIGCTVGACASAADYASTACVASADRVCMPRPIVTGVSGAVLYVENSPAVQLATEPALIGGIDDISRVIVSLQAGASFANDKLTFPPAENDGIPDLQQFNEVHANEFLNVESMHPSSFTFTPVKGASHFPTMDFLPHAISALRFHTDGEMFQQTSNRVVSVDYMACAMDVYKSEKCGAISTLTVDVQPINDRPVIAVPAAHGAKYTQNGAAFAFATGVSITDVDHANLERATIKIESPQVGDVLNCAGSNEISSSYNADTGEMVLSGKSTISAYQDSIRSCTFAWVAPNATMHLSTAPREISVFVFDGLAISTSVPIIEVPICAAVGFAGGTGEALPCKIGTYTNDACSATCTPCGAGMYGSAPNTCAQCTTGTFQLQSGQTSCARCSAGTFGDAGTHPSSAGHCVACAAGRYQPTEGKTSCTACVPGKYAGAISADSCSSCPAGHFAATEGSVTCTACDIGTANPSMGSTSAAACKQCEKGTYQDMAASAECKGWTCCDGGSFIANADHTKPGTCQVCTFGTFRAGRSCYDEQCLSWGSMCAAGFERVGGTTTQTASCTVCAAGSYRLATAGHALCTQCAAGKASATVRSVSPSACKACATGQFSVGAGNTACQACATDEYGATNVPTSSDTHCKSCPIWSPWSACTKTCGTGGTRTRWRAASTAPGADVCPQDATQACNRHKCPAKDHCVYLKCRYRKNAFGKYAIQVYHHRKDAPSVHHCKLYEGEHGTTPKCHCFCWYHGQAPALKPIDDVGKIALYSATLNHR